MLSPLCIYDVSTPFIVLFHSCACYACFHPLCIYYVLHPLYCNVPFVSVMHALTQYACTTFPFFHCKVPFCTCYACFHYVPLLFIVQGSFLYLLSMLSPNMLLLLPPPLIARFLFVPLSMPSPKNAFTTFPTPFIVMFHFVPVMHAFTQYALTTFPSFCCKVAFCTCYACFHPIYFYYVPLPSPVVVFLSHIALYSLTLFTVPCVIFESNYPSSFTLSFLAIHAMFSNHLHAPAFFSRFILFSRSTAC